MKKMIKKFSNDSKKIPPFRSGFSNVCGKYVECYSKLANNGVAGANEAISTFGFNISSSKEATTGKTGARPSKWRIRSN
jgi:hypothetical protein